MMTTDNDHIVMAIGELIKSFANPFSYTGPSYLGDLNP